MRFHRRFRGQGEGGLLFEEGAEKVTISVPPTGSMPIYVQGVNHKDCKSSDTVVSNASFTTNYWAPLAKVVRDNFGIVKGWMTTVHAVVAKQLMVDDSSRGGEVWRGGRCASHISMPSSTGVSTAVGKVVHSVSGKLTGLAFCVPTPDVSLADLMRRSEEGAQYEDIVAAVKAVAAKDTNGVLDFMALELMSSDFVLCKAASTDEALNTL